MHACVLACILGPHTYMYTRFIATENDMVTFACFLTYQQRLSLFFRQVRVARGSNI